MLKLYNKNDKTTPIGVFLFGTVPAFWTTRIDSVGFIGTASAFQLQTLRNAEAVPRKPIEPIHRIQNAESVENNK